jgi:hypothetical protein
LADTAGSLQLAPAHALLVDAGGVDNATVSVYGPPSYRSVEGELSLYTGGFNSGLITMARHGTEIWSANNAANNYNTVTRYTYPAGGQPLAQAAITVAQIVSLAAVY